MLREDFDLLPTSRVLDVGCGSGVLAIGAMAFVLWWRGRNKFVGAVVIVFAQGQAQFLAGARPAAPEPARSARPSCPSPQASCAR